jgi:hypothetical protein
MSSEFEPPYRSNNRQGHDVYVQFAPRPATNGLAIAGLITGIVGTALSLIPFLGVFMCWLPALLGVIFGCLGLGTSKRNGMRRAESTWAIALGLAPIPITILYLLIGAGVASSFNAPH